MQRQIPYLFALTATALAAAGMAGCSTEEASTSECSPVDPAAVREALPDSLGEAKLDPQSAEKDDHSFSALYRAEDNEQVSLLGTKYEAEGAPVCPDDPNEAAQRYLELLHDDLDAQNADQQRPANEYSPFEFTTADRRFYCSAWPVEESVSTTCVTTVGDVALNYYLHRDGHDSAAEQQRMEDIGSELAPALQDLD
ncbi:hypothetical protein Q0N65_05075 [Corynebacterium tuberculostearicum]|uniref:hypothetical protein n=1 Tax=Corynebacterium tuberculostearicum TaxID=38304 RepID=UPI002651907A|nr:hypothetical protein [Corynebacterium tuberculostearicum]MDN8596644.1 hypothetical protein [Corynebacterium tuberculostearicum]